MVRFLVDGNNLMFALAGVAIDADRAALGRILGELAQRERTEIVVVFDGRARRGRGARQAMDDRVEVSFSGPRSADEVLAERIDADTAPRQLAVVSSDRQVQKHARRRRCKVIDAAAFARLLKAPPPRPGPTEPRAKTHGLAKGQLARWLREFGLPEEPSSDTDIDMSEV